MNQNDFLFGFIFFFSNFFFFFFEILLFIIIKGVGFHGCKWSVFSNVRLSLKQLVTSPVQIEPIAPIMAVERRRRLDVIALFNSLLRSLEIFEQELCWECSGLRFNVHVGRLRAFSTAVLAFCFLSYAKCSIVIDHQRFTQFQNFHKALTRFEKKNFVGNVQDYVLMSTWADWGRFQRQFWSFVFIMRQVLHRLSLRCRTLFQSLKAF